MEEEPDFGIGQLLPYQLGKEHQVIVVYPDFVIRSRDLHNPITKDFVHPLVGIPAGEIIDDVLREVVEERPDGPVAEPSVVSVYIAG